MKKAGDDVSALERDLAVQKERYDVSVDLACFDPIHAEC